MPLTLQIAVLFSMKTNIQPHARNSVNNCIMDPIIKIQKVQTIDTKQFAN